MNTQSDSANKPSVSHGGAIALVVLAGALAYSNSLRGPFIFDDKGAIVENESLRDLTHPWAVFTGSKFATVVGRPLLSLSLAINYAVGGTDVFGYHVVNVLIHILTSLTLYGVIRRTLMVWNQTCDRAGTARLSFDVALVVALMWELHPLQTESVTYIVQRAESLVGLWFFVTFYCVIRGATSVSRDAKRSAEAAPLNAPLRVAANQVAAGWYVLAIVACLLGMATKEVMATLPVLMILYDRVFLAGSFREAWRLRKKLHVAFACCWVFLGMLMLSSGGRNRTAGFGFGVSSWDYAMTQFGAIVNYLKLCFWPHPLILDYGTRLAHAPGELIPYAIVIVLFLIGTAIAWRRQPWVGFLGTWFFLILAPSSSVVPLVTQTVAEHRMYLPLAAVIVLTVVVAEARLFRKSRASLPRLPSVIACAVIVTLGVLTFLRNRDYQTEVAIWQDTARKVPDNPRAHVNYAALLMETGHFAEAVPVFDNILRLDPKREDIYNSRGHAYRQLREFDRALPDFDKAIELKPEFAIAYYNRGSTFLDMGQFEKAVDEFSRAIEITPDYSDAFTNRAVAYSRLKQFDKAIADFTQTINFEPRNAALSLNRGTAYLEWEKYDLAIVDFTRAIELQPDYALAYSNRALCYFKLKEYDRALSDVKKFQQLGGTPDPNLLRQLEGKHP